MRGLFPSPAHVLIAVYAASMIGPGRAQCEVVAPGELDVFYEATVPVQIRPAGVDGHDGRTAVQVVLDGAVVATVSCSSASSLLLKHLVAGPHVLSLLPVHGATSTASASAVGARNVSFFVSAEMFWEGQASPARLHAAAQRDQCRRDDERVCDGKLAEGGGGPMFWVIMTAYNAERWIDKAISSLRQQRHCHFACVIIDDASTDASLDLVRQAVCRDPRFFIIANTERKGAACNQQRALDPQLLARAERAVAEKVQGVGEAGKGGDGLTGPRDEDVVVWVS